MKPREQLSATPATIPTATSWYLADLGEARGRQELFTTPSPQRLKVLRERALIESAVSSNRLEGVTVDPSRLGAIVLGRALLRDRNEEEVRGYRDALNLIHERGARLPVSEQTILKLHRLIRGDIWDADRYKGKERDIIERDPSGHQRIRFKTVPATKTRSAMRTLIDLWDRGLRERWVHPLIALAGMNLDFLCIHPFRDGNGRVSRYWSNQPLPRLMGRLRSPSWNEPAPASVRIWSVGCCATCNTPERSSALAGDRARLGGERA